MINIRPFFDQDLMDEVTENLHAADSWTRYFIVQSEEKLIGFTQFYDTHKAPEGDWSNTPPNTVGIDYMIGEGEYIGKGFGTMIVRAIVDEIKSQNQFSHIIADPIPENVASITVLTKNGFRPMANGLYILDINYNNQI